MKANVGNIQGRKRKLKEQFVTFCNDVRQRYKGGGSCSNAQWLAHVALA